ncbi:hypothetical protein MANES_06G009101v8 [Manihot esculenta]|uniref:Uncharacterized protein n=1 Tax=Manihot esculenta TaxID=3983 RepID=A0ACB7HIY4_MANES|nr:hypothetical protein MANES_06G009101v8 [Manihot esculenta]
MQNFDFGLMGSLHEGGNDSNQNTSEQETQTIVLDVNVTNNSSHVIEKLKSKELVLERRVSQRLKNIPQDKRPYYGDDNNGGKKKSKVDFSAKDCQPDEARKEIEDKGTESGSAIGEPDDTEIMEIEDDAYLKWTDYEGFIADSVHQKAINRVKETIRIFNKHSLHFAQNESPITDTKRSVIRPDLKAITEMQNENEVLYPEKMIGHLPGIAVGYQFTSRAEMVAIGFHGHWLNGIDYISKVSGKLNQNYGYTCPLAVAIVMSGQYEDDVDCIHEVVYTGQGGNDLHRSKHQIKDQVMHRGNLALKNSMEQCVPIRVIRGHKLGVGVGRSRSRKVYTYCGLYKVVKHWAEKGISGHNVFKYRLKRLLGQPKVNIDKVHYERQRNSNVSSRLPGLVCEDISYGKEAICIPATNMIDHPPIAPAGFKYTKSVQVTESITVPPSAYGCSCRGQCTDPKSCSCAQLNGSDFPYVCIDGGRLIEPKDVLFECGPKCSCGPNCINRVSQRQLRYQLEVYRVDNKGWAVRSWDFIPSGAPVCEYAGILRRNDELDNVSENDYIFDIDCWHTMKGIGGRKKRQHDRSIPTSDLAEKEDHELTESIATSDLAEKEDHKLTESIATSDLAEKEDDKPTESIATSDLAEKEDDKLTEIESEFCIDAGSCGNVARFINHSCEPNLFVQCVLSSHHDVRFARIVLVAADNIRPMQELTYDYGYALDSVVGPDGKIKQAPCFCGASQCRGRLY